MKRVAYVSGKIGDSRVPYAYRVRGADGRERVIRYYPRGRKTVSFQQVTLTPWAKAHPDECRRILAGR